MGPTSKPHLGRLCVFSLALASFRPRSNQGHPRVEEPNVGKTGAMLTGKAAALNRFISRSSDKCQPFFNLVKKATDFLWTEECKAALTNLKKYLTTAPVLSNPEPGEELFCT